MRYGYIYHVIFYCSGGVNGRICGYDFKQYVLQRLEKKDLFITAAVFGLFQGLMPVIGYILGNSFSSTISAFDHWISLLLLGLIGGKMMVDGIRELRHPEECSQRKQFTYKLLFTQAIATSIDALAVGINFSIMNVNIFLAAGLITVVTFVICLVGATIGKKFGGSLGSKSQIGGGLILIFIGVKIFIEHTM